MANQRVEHKNSFDFLRLFAALLVFHSHQYALSGLPERVLPWIGTTISGLGVAAFFVISGYLVSRSADRSINPITFFTNRALRIMPGLTMNVVFMVLLGSAITSIPISEYLTSKEVFDFLFRNIFIAFNEPSYSLPGVFENNPHDGVNGSLWTLPYEIGFYFILFVLFFCIRNKTTKTIAIFLLTLVTGCLVVSRSFFPDFNPVVHTWGWFLVKPLAVNGLCFCLGSLIHLTSNKNIAWLLPKVIAISLLFMFGFTSQFSAYLLFCYMVLLLGETKFVVIPKRIGDISYGVYLYAFPIQQTVIYYVGYESFYINYMLSLFLTIFFAFLSWHYVEKASLSLKPLFSKRGIGTTFSATP